MKTLIISDIHLRQRFIDEILAWEGSYDKVICLGDYWDQWNDTPQQAEDAAKWLKPKLYDPKFIMLLGNHDVSYVFPYNSNTSCSGFSKTKSSLIRNVLNQDDFLRLKICHTEGNILFSHAGFDRDWFRFANARGYETPDALTLPNITEWIERIWPKVLDDLSLGKNHPLIEAGRNRGGFAEVGSPIWQDFGSHCPIPGIIQVVGHSIQDADKGPLCRLISKDKSPTWRLASKGINPKWLKDGGTLCLDTCNRHYMVLENNVITIKSVKWERITGEDNYSVFPGSVIETIDLNTQPV